MLLLIISDVRDAYLVAVVSVGRSVSALSGKATIWATGGFVG